MDLILTTDFKTASQTLKRELPLYRARLSPEEFAKIPAYFPEPWNEARFENTCYNFAIDKYNKPDEEGNDTDIGQPGDFSDFTALRDRHGNKIVRDIQSYADEVHEDVLNDGLIYLGHSFAGAVKEGFPVALFLEDGSRKRKDHDYHWEAVRRKDNDLIIAGKDGLRRVHKSGFWGDIFSRSAGAGYKIFAGWYEVPHKQFRSNATFDRLAPVAQPA